MSGGGKYSHRITLEGRTESRDQYGGAVLVWTDAYPTITGGIPADYVPLSGREFVQSAVGQSEVTVRFEIPYVAGVTPTMRVQHDGNTYAIKAVLPDPTARRHITLMCADVEGAVST